ncbi:MAG: TIM barrel protein [Pseudomonadota bacterium]
MYSVLNVTDDITHCGNIGHVLNDFKNICLLAHQYGFKGVNVDLTDSEFDTYKYIQLLEKYKLKPVAFGLPVKLFDSDKVYDDSIEEFELQASKANSIGCHLTLCYIPPFSQEMNFNDRFIQTSKRLRELKRILEKYDIKIGFEFIGPTETRVNSKYDFIHTIDGIRALIASAGLYGYAGFKLDVHHWQNSGSSILDIQHLDMAYILYIELNDGLPGYNIFNIPEFKRELPLATGITQIEEFMNTLKQKGYQGPVAIEPWNENIKTMPLKEALEKIRHSFSQLGIS